MKILTHFGYEAKTDVESIDDCRIDNTNEPVVRVGGEPFTSYYDVEWYYYVKHVIDPTRSLVKPIRALLECDRDETSLWPICDILFRLLRDLGFDPDHSTDADIVKFRTMFPAEAAEFLAKSYMKTAVYMNRREGYVRVLNNPSFHAQRNASDRLLVEIAAENGVRYALDRSKCIASPEVLATEIALLNYGYKQPTKVSEAEQRLALQIRGVMDDWGLVVSERQ